VIKREGSIESKEENNDRECSSPTSLTSSTKGNACSPVDFLWAYVSLRYMFYQTLSLPSSNNLVFSAPQRVRQTDVSSRATETARLA